MTDTTIRAATPADLPRIRALISTLSAFHGETATVRLEQLQEAFFADLPRAHAIVAEHGGKLIGYAGITDISSLHEDRPRLDINHLIVADGYRAKGIGRALIAAAARYAQVRNAIRLTIGTAPDNAGAQAAYHAMGLDEQTDFAPRFHIPLG